MIPVDNDEGCTRIRVDFFRTLRRVVRIGADTEISESIYRRVIPLPDHHTLDSCCAFERVGNFVRQERISRRVRVKFPESVSSGREMSLVAPMVLQASANFSTNRVAEMR